MLGPFAGQQAQQASADSPTLWTPGESSTLLGWWRWDDWDGSEIANQHAAGPPLVGNSESGIAKETSALSVPSTDFLSVEAVDPTDRARLLAFTFARLVNEPGRLALRIPFGSSNDLLTIGSEQTIIQWGTGEGEFRDGSNDPFTPPVGVFSIVVIYSVDTQTRLRVNGVNYTRVTENYGPFFAGAYGSGVDLALFGGDAMPSPDYRTHDIAVDHDVSLANIQRYEGWLAHETGLTSLLPASHPYKSSPPTT